MGSRRRRFFPLGLLLVARLLAWVILGTGVSTSALDALIILACLLALGFWFWERRKIGGP